jgi:Chaperone of endosialidase
MTTLQLTKSIYQPCLRRRVLFIGLVLVLAYFALSPAARGVLPPPDGGYPGANTAEGDDALFSLISGGTFNTAIGFQALFSNTTGDANTATGALALLSNRTGIDNTATGFTALQNNTTGDGNTATGAIALLSNTTGNDNTATGVEALQSNTTGYDNTANGAFALRNNTTGVGNTASGSSALSHNTTGVDNTANGFQALQENTTGIGNTATGALALQENTTGIGNTANGVNALHFNTTGNTNTANGAVALFHNTTGDDNTADGFQALQNNTTGVGNIALGAGAGSNLTTGNNNVDIGNAGVAAEANTIRIGTQGTQTATFIAGVSGAGVMGSAVKVNAVGQLGTAPSSARFKQNIKQMDKASEAIHALKPVSFHYKKEIDPECTLQFGLVAEEVEKVSPDLVDRDPKGKVYTVRYEAVNAMLLNEFLKEHREVQQQKAIIAELKKGLEAVTTRLKDQEAELQKVSAQLEMSRPMPQIVANDQ